MKRYLFVIVVILTACTPSIQKTEIPLPKLITPTEMYPSSTPTIFDPTNIDYGMYWNIFRDNSDDYAFAYPSQWLMYINSETKKPNEISICNYSFELSSDVFKHSEWKQDYFYKRAYCIYIVEYSTDNKVALLPLDQIIKNTLSRYLPEGYPPPEWISVYYPEESNPNKVLLRYKGDLGENYYQIAFKTRTNTILLINISNRDQLPTIETIALINSIVLDKNGIVELPKIIPGERITEEMLK